MNSLKECWKNKEVYQKVLIVIGVVDLLLHDFRVDQISETWYVKVSKTVATAAILKLLIRPDSSADPPKIMSIQYKTQDHDCSNIFS